MVHTGRKLLAVMILSIASLYGAPQSVAQDAFDYNGNQVLHPEWFIKITDWSFFTAARVAMLSSVTIENTADVAYKDIQVKLLYTSYSSPVSGIIATTTTMLPVTLPPKSKDKYLKGGLTVGAGNQNYKLGDIVVLSATPVEN